jgi:hypothetical protein
MVERAVLSVYLSTVIDAEWPEEPRPLLTIPLY